MGILKNRPFVLRDIMAFLVLEVLSSLEVDGVSQIFTPVSYTHLDVYKRQVSV